MYLLDKSRVGALWHGPFNYHSFPYGVSLLPVSVYSSNGATPISQTLFHCQQASIAPSKLSTYTLKLLHSFLYRSFSSGRTAKSESERRIHVLFFFWQGESIKVGDFMALSIGTCDSFYLSIFPFSIMRPLSRYFIASLGSMLTNTNMV
jgi:hypothetical protein